jgi:hypothetical protein
LAGLVLLRSAWSAGCRRWNLDHDTAIDKQTQLIDVEVLALGPKLPLEQPVQVSLEQLDQLPLLIEHEVQRLHIGGITCSGSHGDMLPNASARESPRNRYLQRS